MVLLEHRTDGHGDGSHRHDAYSMPRGDPRRSISSRRWTLERRRPPPQSRWRLARVDPLPVPMLSALTRTPVAVRPDAIPSDQMNLSCKAAQADADRKDGHSCANDLWPPRGHRLPDDRGNAGPHLPQRSRRLHRRTCSAAKAGLTADDALSSLHPAGRCSEPHACVAVNPLQCGFAAPIRPSPPPPSP